MKAEIHEEAVSVLEKMKEELKKEIPSNIEKMKKKKTTQGRRRLL